MSRAASHKPSATSRILKFWPFLLLALLPVIPLWRCVFLGEAIGPFDQIRQMAPWNGPKPAQPWDVLQADGVLQFYPWRDLVLKGWANGQVPLWNPYELAGTPLLANSQSAGFYPPHVALGVLHVPTALAMTLLAWFHLFWAGLGTYFLARRFGASREGAAIAGASFQLSAFMLAWTGLPSVISTVAWIPWLLAGIMGVFECSRYGGPTIRPAAIVALSAGMMILAGHLQFVAYGFMAAGFLLVWLTIESWLRRRHPGEDAKIRPARPAGLVIFGFMVGFALAAPQLLPVLNYSQFSHRKTSPTPEGYTAYNASAIQPFELVGIAYPQLLGLPDRYVKVEGVEAEVPGFWPAYAKRGANYAESAVGLGPLVFFLLFCLRKHDFKRVAPMLGIGAIGLLLAVGSWLGWLLYNYFPGWASTGSPGRAECLFVLAACVIAGCAVSRRREANDGRDGGDPADPAPTQSSIHGVSGTSWRRLYAPLITLAILTVVSFAAVPQIGRMLALAGGGDLTEVALAATRYPMAMCGIACVLILGFGAVWLRQGCQNHLWLFLALIGSGLVAPGFTLRSGEPDLAAVAPRFDRVAVVNSDWELMAAAPAILPPNTGSLSHLHELGGYDSLLHKETDAMLHEVDGQDPAPPANGNMMFVKPSANPGALANAGVAEVWTRSPLNQFGEFSSTEGGVYRYRLAGPGRASSPGGPAEVLSEGLSQLRVRATGPGRLVVRDRNMPGWLAKVDGKHVPLEGTMWREVDLPPGEHTVEFNYVPPGMLTGLLLALPAWVLLLVGAVVGWQSGGRTSE